MAEMGTRMSGTGTRARCTLSRHTAPTVPRPAATAFLAALAAAVARGLSDPGFTVDALAVVLATNPRQLARRLAALTGETPGAYLRRMRLARAVGLLTAGMPVGHAALAVGYASRSQFSRAFREATGRRPAAVRRAREVLMMSQTGTAMARNGMHA